MEDQENGYGMILCHGIIGCGHLPSATRENIGKERASPQVSSDSPEMRRELWFWELGRENQGRSPVM